MPEKNPVSAIGSFDNTDLPFDLEAEQAVLGAVLLDPDCLSTVALYIKPEYFYLPQHKAIYTAILRLDATYGGKIDPLTVKSALTKDKMFDDESGRSYLLKLGALVPTTANVEAYAKIVREQYYIRSLMTAAGEITDTCRQGGHTADELLDIAEQRIYDIRQGKSVVGPSKLSDLISDVYENLYTLSGLGYGEYAGLSTGFSELDRKITGLNKSDLILIGARPAMGKTSFALNLAANVARGGKKVLFFSLEMSKEQLASRVISSEARVMGQKFRTGDLNQEEWDAISETAEYLSDFELYFDDTANITVPEMKARARQLKNVDCIMIDYLQLMSSSKRTDNRVQEVSDITRNLKMMAKDLNIPVVTLAQLARKTEEKGRSHKPKLSDLRESGSIEQDADIVLMLYREDYYKQMEETENIEEQRVDEAELLIEKNRHGPTGNVGLNWNKEFTLFTSREYMNGGGEPAAGAPQ